LKQCTNCRGNLADFVAVCPFCGVAQPLPQFVAPQPGWGLAPQNSNKALASVICGALFFFTPAAIAAVILGHLALSDIKRSVGRLTGQGLAVAGLVMGYIGIAFAALFFIAVGIGVRNAMRQNVSANELASIQTMKKYNEALKAYAEKCPQQGYPAALASLGPGSGDCTRANLLDAGQTMARPVKLGYQFAYSPGEAGAERVTVFALVASPVQPGITGKRYFFLDEGGVIRQADSRIVGPRSDPVDNPESGTDDEKNEQ
jgi:hypothetical protein